VSESTLPPPDLASLLTILGDAVSNEVIGALEGTGLRRRHGYLIQRLLVAPTTATEMATELGISQQAVSKTVKELVSLGHVEMTTDPVDSRRRPARLTHRGLAAVSRARSARQLLEERIRGVLGGDRFDALFVDLQQVLDVLGLSDEVNRRAVPPPAGELE
jgi:DNA-binding MarR family transcriptional regulator